MQYTQIDSHTTQNIVWITEQLDQGDPVVLITVK